MHCAHVEQRSCAWTCMYLAGRVCQEGSCIAPLRSPLVYLCNAQSVRADPGACCAGGLPPPPARRQPDRSASRLRSPLSAARACTREHACSSDNQVITGDHACPHPASVKRIAPVLHSSFNPGQARSARTDGVNPASQQASYPRLECVGHFFTGLVQTGRRSSQQGTPTTRPAWTAWTWCSLPAARARTTPASS